MFVVKYFPLNTLSRRFTQSTDAQLRIPPNRFPTHREAKILTRLDKSRNSCDYVNLRSLTREFEYLIETKARIKKVKDSSLSS